MHPNDEQNRTVADNCADDDLDRRLVEAIGRLPAPNGPTDLPHRVATQLARRRAWQRLGALAAAVLFALLGWRVWLVGKGPGSDGIDVAAERASQKALVAQWDQLLDEAAAVPPPVVELSILNTQQAWISALRQIQPL